MSDICILIRYLCGLLQFVSIGVVFILVPTLTEVYKWWLRRQEAEAAEMQTMTTAIDDSEGNPSNVTMIV